MIKNCKWCGKEFNGQRETSLYCSQFCYRDAKKYKRLEAERLAEMEKNKPVKNNMAEIIRIAVEARAHGMSYGKYIEMLAK